MNDLFLRDNHYCVLNSPKKRTLVYFYVLKIIPAFVFWENWGHHNLLSRLSNLYNNIFFSYRYKWCQSITWENFDWNKKTSRTRLIVIMCSSAKNNNCNSCICLRCQRLVMANLVTSNSPVRIVPSSPEVSRGTVISS